MSKLMGEQLQTLEKDPVASSWVYKTFRHLYFERKAVMLALAHFIFTMTAWFHFFFTKYDIQETKVPDGANRYWWKRLIPPLQCMLFSFRWHYYLLQCVDAILQLCLTTVI